MSEPTATESSETESAPSNGAIKQANKTDSPMEENFFGQMEQLLDKLVPPDTVSVMTCTGKEIVLPGAISARRQVKVFRHMKELIEVDAVALALGSISKGDGSAGAIIDVVIQLATDEKIAELLGAIFQEAYPDACGDQHPLDVLPMEELVVALVPFSERFVKRVGSGVLTLGKSANQLTS